MARIFLFLFWCLCMLVPIPKKWPNLVIIHHFVTIIYHGHWICIKKHAWDEDSFNGLFLMTIFVIWFFFWSLSKSFVFILTAPIREKAWAEKIILWNWIAYHFHCCCCCCCCCCCWCVYCAQKSRYVKLVCHMSMWQAQCNHVKSHN